MNFRPGAPQYYIIPTVCPKAPTTMDTGTKSLTSGATLELSAVSSDSSTSHANTEMYISTPANLPRSNQVCYHLL